MFEKFPHIPSPWKPVLDFPYLKDPVFPSDPVELIKSGKFHKVPTIIGGNKNEGAYRTSIFIRNPEKYEEIVLNWDNMAPIFLLSVDEDSVVGEDSSAVNLIRDFYLKSGNFNENNCNNKNEFLN